MDSESELLHDGTSCSSQCLHPSFLLPSSCAVQGLSSLLSGPRCSTLRPCSYLTWVLAVHIQHNILYRWGRVERWLGNTEKKQAVYEQGLDQSVVCRVWKAHSNRAEFVERFVFKRLSWEISREVRCNFSSVYDCFESILIEFDSCGPSQVIFLTKSQWRRMDTFFFLCLLWPRRECIEGFRIHYSLRQTTERPWIALQLKVFSNPAFSCWIISFHWNVCVKAVFDMYTNPSHYMWKLKGKCMFLMVVVWCQWPIPNTIPCYDFK